ncbi:MAG: MCE family protein [Alphaproteobacteria bacterium]|nr:MCE family protein [Alphaproteobacteria bacterium]
METEKYYFRVGFFCLAVLIGLVWLLFAFGGGHDSKNFVRYAIYFDNSVSGLARGAPVKLRGIEVGLVDDLHFVSRDNDRIVAVVDIVDNAPIREDTVASIDFQGITGTSYISLDNTESNAPPAFLRKKPGQEFPVIQSKKSGLQNVLSNAPELMGKLALTNQQLQKLLSDQNIGALQGLFVQAHDLMLESTATMREIRMLARTLREDPAVVLHGDKYRGYKVKDGAQVTK